MFFLFMTQLHLHLNILFESNSFLHHGILKNKSGSQSPCRNCRDERDLYRFFNFLLAKRIPNRKSIVYSQQKSKVFNRKLQSTRRYFDYTVVWKFQMFICTSVNFFNITGLEETTNLYNSLLFIAESISNSPYSFM